MMLGKSASSFVFFLGVLVLRVGADVCLLVYQMADNNLEAFLRNDNFELVSSEGIRDPTLTTWVYFDGRNYGTDEDITKPLRDIYFSDGTPVTEKNEGSTYLRWSHDLQKMVVEGFLQGEQDSDHPQILFDFLSYAMRDCVEKGSTEYMLIMASHGNGMYGFGGDDNKSRRRLALSNSDMVLATRAALENVEGAPEKFDVVGFDACSMQSVDVADDLRHVTKYLLASEAAEPAEGWTYNFLDAASTASALGIAKNLHDNFLHRTQDADGAVPKLIAISDMSKFSTFLGAFDSFFAELSKEMLKDQNVYNIISKTRKESIAFTGGRDDFDTDIPSLTDVGSFLNRFRDLCGPLQESVLDLRLQEAEAAYSDQFISRGFGPGAPRATGMTIMFPRKQNVEKESELHHHLLNMAFHTSTRDVPKWLEFLENYYFSPAPGKWIDASVCSKTANSSEKSHNAYSAKMSLRRNRLTTAGNSQD